MHRLLRIDTAPLLRLSSRCRPMVTLLVIALLGSTNLASAQSTPTQADRQRQNGMYKMIAGGSLAAVGGLVLAMSHQSASVNTSFGKISGSATNMGGVVTGIGMLGAGGYLLYVGISDRKEAATSPSQTFAVEFGKRKGLHVVRRW
jgi:hypothetical protein